MTLPTDPPVRSAAAHSAWWGLAAFLLLGSLAVLVWSFLPEDVGPGPGAGRPARDSVDRMGVGAADEQRPADSAVAKPGDRRAVDSEPPSPVSTSDSHQCRLRFDARTESGAVVSNALLTFAYRVGEEPVHGELALAQGSCELVVPAGAELLRVFLAPLEHRIPALAELGDPVRTSGFVAWSAHEHWFEDDGFDPVVAADRRLEIVVSTGVSVRGRVVDASTGRGIAAAWVVVQQPWDELVGNRSEPDGSFHVDGVEAFDSESETPLVVAAAHPRYRLTRVPSPPVSAGGTVVEGVLLRMEPAVHLAGSVLDAAGTPLPGADVLMLQDRRFMDGQERMSASRATRTEASGRFEFWGVPVSDHVELAVGSPGRYGVEHMHGPFVLRTDLDGVVVRMPGQAVVRLRPLQPDGTPLAATSYVAVLTVDGQAMRCLPQLDQAFAVPLGRRIGWEVFPSTSLPSVALTGAGTDTFTTAGPHERLVTLSPLADDAPRGPGLQPAGGERVESITLGVRSTHAAHEFLVEVVPEESGGVPIAGARLAVDLAAGSAATTLGERGRIRLLLPAGVHWCRFQVDGGAEQHFRLHAMPGGQSRLELRPPTPR